MFALLSCYFENGRSVPNQRSIHLKSKMATFVLFAQYVRKSINFVFDFTFLRIPFFLSTVRNGHQSSVVVYRWLHTLSHLLLKMMLYLIFCFANTPIRCSSHVRTRMFYLFSNLLVCFFVCKRCETLRLRREKLWISQCVSFSRIRIHNSHESYFKIFIYASKIHSVRKEWNMRFSRS